MAMTPQTSAVVVHAIVTELPVPGEVAVAALPAALVVAAFFSQRDVDGDVALVVPEPLAVHPIIGLPEVLDVIATLAVPLLPVAENKVFSGVVWFTPEKDTDPPTSVDGVPPDAVTATVPAPASGATK